jgi:hypothetical protein
MPKSDIIMASGSPYIETKREEREEKRRQKELLQRLKEEAKLDLLERDKLEVEAYENEIQILQTVHRDCSDPMDWKALAYSLPPHQPAFSSPAYLRASLNSSHPAESSVGGTASTDAAWELDTEKYKAICERYQEDYEDWSRKRSLSERVLSGEPNSYLPSIHEFCWFGEIATWGDAFSLTAHDSKHVECKFPVNGNDIIPKEVKSLTSSGKLSVRQMPKGQFQELYRAYVCGCCLKVGREVLALLPVDEVIVTATVLMLSTATGLDTQQPVLSVLLDRKTIEALNFERLDPEDALENFRFSGSINGPQKNDQFASITPLSFDCNQPNACGEHSIDRHLVDAMALRKTLQLPTKSKGRAAKPLPETLVTSHESEE